MDPEKILRFSVTFRRMLSAGWNKASLTVEEWAIRWGREHKGATFFKKFGDIGSRSDSRIRQSVQGDIWREGDVDF